MVVLVQSSTGKLHFPGNQPGRAKCGYRVSLISEYIEDIKDEDGFRDVCADDVTCKRCLDFVMETKD